LFLQWLKQHEGKEFPKRDVDEEAHIFSGMMIALSDVTLTCNAFDNLIY